MPNIAAPDNKTERLVKARALRLNQTLDELFAPWWAELAGREILDDDPILDIKPLVGKYEDRATARATSEGRV